MKIIILTLLSICSGTVFAQSVNTDECKYDIDCNTNEICFFGECKIENEELREYVTNNYTEEALNYCKNNVPEMCSNMRIGTISLSAECDNIFFNHCKSGFRCNKGKCEPKDKDDTSLNRAEILEMAREKQENEESLNFQEMYVLKQEEKAQELFLKGSKKIFSDKVDWLFDAINHGTGKFSDDDLNSLKKYIDQYLQELNEKFSYELQQDGIEFLYDVMESWQSKINNDKFHSDIQIFIKNKNLQFNKPSLLTQTLPKTGFPSILQQITNFLMKLFR